MKYEVIATGKYDKHLKFRPSQYEQVITIMLKLLELKKTMMKMLRFFERQKSTASALLKAAQADKNVYWEKKNKTHKQILVNTGVTGFVKKPIWIQKTTKEIKNDNYSI